MEGCGPCQTAKAALFKVQPRWAEAMEILDCQDPKARELTRGQMMSYPTLLVIDESTNKVAAKITGSNNLTEEFWTKAFIVK